MRAVSSTGSIPTKRVRVEDVADTDTDAEILEVALAFTGETRSSLYGTHVDRFGTVACVSLHTD
jgi:hypothetical protein